MYIYIYVYIYIYIYIHFFPTANLLGLNLQGRGLMRAPQNRNSPGTLLRPFAVGLQSWANLCIYHPCAFHIWYMPAFNMFSVWAELSSLLNFQKRQLPQMNFEGVKVNWVPCAYLHKGKGSQRWCYSFQDIGPGQSTLGSRNLWYGIVVICRVCRIQVFICLYMFFLILWWENM